MKLKYPDLPIYLYILMPALSAVTLSKYLFSIFMRVFSFEINQHRNLYTDFLKGCIF